MSKKIIFLFICLTLILSGCIQKNTNQAQESANKEPAKEQVKEPGQMGMANPASVYCQESGGQLTIKNKKVGEKNYGQYGICTFTDNRQCEKWALFHGYCPKGGLKITGYDNEEQIYCAIIGGQVEMDKNLCIFNNGAECDIDDIYVGACNQHFNEPTTDWQYKKYPEAKVLIGYLNNEVYFSNEDEAKDDKLLGLTIAAQEINSILVEETMGYDRATSKSDAASLVKGEYGDKQIDFAVAGSQKVVKLNNGYAKEFIVLGRFEVCDTTLERIAIFYNNGYQIIIKLTGDREKIIKENPEYFSKDNANCGDELIWDYKNAQDENMQEKFYQALSTGKLKGEAADWYNTFNQIIEAIIIQK